MGFFDDESRMYIPLTIDTTEVRRTNYFFSNRKMVEMVVALLPFIFMIYPMLQGGVRWVPIAIVSVVYAILYIYFLRFRIFEENLLRKMVQELDKNKISGLDHFWGINKIGDKGMDDGVIHYKRLVTMERGIVVAFDRGSTVGVEEGNYTRFRQTKMDFLRELSLQKFNFRWYELPKRSETPESMVNYFNLMTEMENENFKRLLKLQIDINILYSTDTEQRYVDYILIRNKNFRTLRRFRKVVQEIIDTTLETNGYIVNARILGKSEIEEFFEDYLMIDSLDSKNIRTGTDVKPFEEFATVKRIIRQDGRDLPLEFIENYDMEDVGRGASIEDLLHREAEKDKYKEKDIERRRERELENARVQRNKDKITSKDYTNLMQEINNKYDKELDELLVGVEYQEVEEEVNVVEEILDEEVEVEVPIHLNVRESMVKDFEEEDDDELTLEELMERDKNN